MMVFLFFSLFFCADTLLYTLTLATTTTTTPTNSTHLMEHGSFQWMVVLCGNGRVE